MAKTAKVNKKVAKTKKANKVKPAFGIRWVLAELVVEPLGKNFDRADYRDVFATWEEARDEAISTLDWFRDTIQDQVKALDGAESFEAYAKLLRRSEGK